MTNLLRHHVYRFLYYETVKKVLVFILYELTELKWQLATMRARRNNLIWAAGTLLSGRKCYQGTCGCLWDYTEGVDNIFTELVWMWSEGFIVEFFCLRESYQGICGWLWEYIV